MKNLPSLLAIAFIAIVALAHLVRLVMKVPVEISGFAVPMWWSAPVFVVLGGLAFSLWRERRH